VDGSEHIQGGLDFPQHTKRAEEEDGRCCSTSVNRREKLSCAVWLGVQLE
jgi:hypothetical protein